MTLKRCFGVRDIAMKSQDDRSTVRGIILLVESSSGENSSSSSRPLGVSATGKTEDSLLYGDDNEVANKGPEKNVHDHDTNNSTSIFITDGTATYMLPFVDFSNLKLTQEQMSCIDPTKWLIDNLLHPKGNEFINAVEQCDSNVKISIHEIQKTDGDLMAATAFPTFTFLGESCIRIHVKVKYQEIVRVVLSLDIPRLSSSSMSFVHELSHFLSDSIDVVQSLCYQLEQMESERNLWKETAENLCVQHWNQEREELMKRFLMLFNRVKGELRVASDKLQEEKQRYTVLMEQYKRQEKILHRYRDRNVLMDHEDDNHDMTLFQEEDVERLAKGIRLDGPLSNHVGNDTNHNKKMRFTVNNPLNDEEKNSVDKLLEPSRDKKKQMDDSVTATVATSSTFIQSNRHMSDLKPSNLDNKDETMRKNPLTGSMEIFNVEAMFSDTSDEG
jgi:hypothetical protein